MRAGVLCAALASDAARRRGRDRVSGVLVALIALGAVVSLPGPALAQASSASYQIPRQSIDAGAGRATSAAYTLHGTIGQPEAGATMTSASYTLRGGFHLAAPAAPLPDPLFSDGFEAL
jgi:hypothetical protein